MRSNSPQVFVVFLALVGTCMAAFYLPFALAGERADTRPDIVLTPRFTATATPLDRALTRQAFAQRFFTPTDSGGFLAFATPTPASTASKAVFPAVVSFGTLPGTATGLFGGFVPNTGATRPVHRPDEQQTPIIVSNTPRPNPTPFKTATRQATVTAPATPTPQSPTPRPTYTPRPPTGTATSPPTSTSVPPDTDTPQPTSTVEPPTVEPPTVEPPTVEPPTVEPPTHEPPTVEPPTHEPPTEEPTPIPI